MFPIPISILSRESYCCIQYLADQESVLLLTIARILTPEVIDQIRQINPCGADSILRDCILMLSIPFAVDLDEVSRVAIQQSYTHFNFIETVSRQLKTPDSKLFEISLGFVTRSVLSNAIHMNQMESILPDLTSNINQAISSSNPVISADSLALVNQYLLVGNINLAFKLLSNDDDQALIKALKHAR